MKKFVFKLVDTLIKANFMLAVLMIVLTGLTVLTDNSTLFAEEEMDLELYGALANNLHLIFIYIAVAEINLFFYCWARKKQSLLVWVGFFYILTIGGLEFYSRMNQVPVPSDYELFFLYQGISHILFGSCYLFRMFYFGKMEAL